MYFEYGESEISYLRKKDKRLCEVIDRVGHIDRVVDTDLFSSVVHHIVGQQISTKAQATIWKRMQDALGEVNAETILAAGVPKLQSLGMSFRKAEYITDFAEKVHTGVFDLDAVEHMSDEDAIRELSSLKGIGVWTAEMILLFCMQRPDIFSYDDLAIKRGLQRIYHHKKIDRKLFERYRKRFSPYCSVASLYLWAAAGGQMPEKTAKTKKSREKSLEKSLVKRKTAMKKNSEDRITYLHHYDSPLGEIVMASDGEALNGLWFIGQKYFEQTLTGKTEEKDLPVFAETDNWLDIYFSGKEPDFLPPIAMPAQASEFQKDVWAILQEIPYGELTTYGEIAAKIAEKQGRESMSAQAVGGAVGHNPVSILVPCHRVVGRDRSLTGYAGGVEKKVRLLELEGHQIDAAGKVERSDFCSNR